MWIDIDQVVTSPWLYVVLVALILTDVYLPVLPSGTTLIVATAYAATHEAPVYPLLLCAAAASVTGDLIAFGLARVGARHLERILHLIPRIGVADANLRRLLRSHGRRTVLVARFVPAGRCIVTNASGRDRAIGVRHFAAWSGIAAVAWAVYTVTIGYVNAQIFDTGWLAAAVSVACLLLLGLWFRRSTTAKAITFPPVGETHGAHEIGDAAK